MAGGGHVCIMDWARLSRRGPSRTKLWLKSTSQNIFSQREGRDFSNKINFNWYDNGT